MTDNAAALQECLREVCLPALRALAADLFVCVSAGGDPATVAGSDWREIAPDMERVLAVEALVGRPRDEHGAILDPILDAELWKHHQ